MTAVRTANRGDIPGMARSGQPIVHGGANLAAQDWWFAGTMMSGNQQDDPLTRPDRPLEAAIDCSPSGIEAHSMEVEGPVRIDTASPQAAVPMAV